MSRKPCFLFSCFSNYCYHHWSLSSLLGLRADVRNNAPRVYNILGSSQNENTFYAVVFYHNRIFCCSSCRVTPVRTTILICARRRRNATATYSQKMHCTFWGSGGYSFPPPPEVTIPRVPGGKHEQCNITIGLGGQVPPQVAWGDPLRGRGA